MYEITNRTQAPYASICYVRVEWSDGTATRASGVVIGINDVLTALHVVYDDRHGGWAKSVTITPAADTAPYFQQPYGSFSDVGSIESLAPNWDLDGDGLLTAEESAGDLALIGMRTRIGDVTGWLPVAQVPNDVNGVMLGYPARGTGMMAEAVFADAQPQGVYDVNAVLGPGASGGPLLVTQNGVASVVGVLSGGSDVDSTYAGLYNAATWSWLNTQLAANNWLVSAAPASTSTGGNFTGTPFADNMFGTAARDTFNGRGGNDRFDGGADIDTAFYSGTRASYTITVGAQGIVVADSVAGRDGTDTLVNVERLRFTDVNMAFDTSGHAGEAYRLYKAAFDRVPDLGGLGYHINDLDNGVYISTVAGHFVASPEFQATYGTLTDEQFVRQLYLNVLDREPEPEGMAYHLHNLQTTATRFDVLAGFSESPENQANVIGLIQNGMIYT